ncbi:PGF-pre-PGF domain-containing protein [Candidatus Woesearchaeota archaeon]|nr:PGF-pre-PGF domain-containing protein [Candidatus Woesearchaeota archaeon]
MVNYSRGIGIAIDRAAPPVTFWINFTNGTNFSTVMSGSKVLLSAISNDSTTYTTSIQFSVDNSNTTGFNLTARRNTSLFESELDFATVADDFYTIQVFSNDSLGNQNSSVLNVSFRIDKAAPAVTLGMNFTNGTNFSTVRSGSKVLFSAISNDSTTYTTSIQFSIDNSNTTGFNLTAKRNTSLFESELDFATVADDFYTIQVFANDSVNNQNGSVLNVSFRIDKAAPAVTLGMNFTNGTNFSSSSLPANVKILLTAYVNDTTTYTRMPVFQLLNGNTTGVNVTGTKNASLVETEVTSTLSDGAYTVTLFVNDSVDNLNNSIANVTFRIDRAAPDVSSFGINFSNGTNFTNTNFGPKILFQGMMNDSVTAPQGVRFGFQSGNGSEQNFTPVLVGNGSLYSTELAISQFTDGVYTVKVYVNDSQNNVNTSISNITVSLDRLAPIVSTFSINFTNGTNFSTVRSGSKVLLSAISNDSTTYTTSIQFSVDNSNNTGFNLTAKRNTSLFESELDFATVADDFYTIQVFANDSVNNQNSSVLNVSFRIDKVPPPVTLWMNFTAGNGSNFSSTGAFGGLTKIELNAISNDSTTYTQGVVFIVTNTNATAAFNVSTSRNGSTFVGVVDTNRLTDDLYRVIVFANDSAQNVNTSIANVSFRVDRTPPNVTNVIVGNRSGGDQYNMSISLSEGLLTFNATVNDSTTALPSEYVIFAINSTNGTEQNFTAGIWNGRWNISLNLTNFIEGTHSVRIYANDSVNNRNVTEYTTFTLDRTTPTVTVTCDPANPTAGQTVTCTCTASDAHTGIETRPVKFTGDTDNQESTTATGSGGTTSTCTVNDFAGNTKTATGSWTVAAAASTGGGGSGGSGGGVSSSVAGTFEQKTWTSILADETASVPLKNGEIGVTNIEFGVSNTVYGAWVKVQKLDQAPVTLDIFTGKVYKYLEITKGISLTNNVIKNAKVEFKVLKSWLKENKVEQGDVALHRYVDNTWTKLKTTFVSDDGIYVHYTAETPGFSYFLIGKASGEKAAAPTAEAEEAPVAEEKAVPTAEAAPEGKPTPTGETSDLTKPKKAVWPWIVVALVVIAIVYVVLRMRKKQEK